MAFFFYLSSLTEPQVTIPVSSANITLRATGLSALSVIVPNVSSYVDDIDARLTDGEMALYEGANEIITADFTDLSYVRTAFGFQGELVAEREIAPVTGVSSLGTDGASSFRQSGGKYTIQVPLFFLFSPGSDLTFDGVTFGITSNTISISPSSVTMTIEGE